MNEFLARFRLPVVTAVLALIGLARSLGIGDGLLPTDEQVTAVVDGVLGGVAAAVWVYTYYKTSTKKDSLEADVDAK